MIKRIQWPELWVIDEQSELDDVALPIKEGTLIYIKTGTFAIFSDGDWQPIVQPAPPSSGD